MASSSAETTRCYLTKMKSSAQKAFYPSTKDHTIQNALAAVHVQKPDIRLSAVKAMQPTGEKGDLFNGLAAIHLGQTGMLSRVGRFSSEEPRPPRTTRFFVDNINPPLFSVMLPKKHQRFHSTLQLAFGRHLFLTIKKKRPPPDTTTTIEEDLQAMGLEETNRQWLTTILKDETEQDHLHWLTSQVVIQFLKSDSKDWTSIAEVSLLGSVLEYHDYRNILSELITQLKHKKLLDTRILLALVFFLKPASADYLIDDDLVRILRVLRDLLDDTHKQLGDSTKPASKNIYLLAMAISRVLDTMAERNIDGMSRTIDHQPLLGIITELKGSPDPYLEFQAKYAWQALQYIGDDESPLRKAFRVGGGLLMASLKIASALNFNIDGVCNGVQAVGDAAGQIVDSINAMTESARAAQEAGEGIRDSVLNALRTGGRRTWYLALQEARIFIQKGQLARFKHVVFKASCCHEKEFQWGVCQLLGEIALDPIWGLEIRQEAVYLLEDLQKSDSGWTKHSSVRVVIQNILSHISKSVEENTTIQVSSLSSSSRQDSGANCEEPYPVIARLWNPKSSPLLSKVLRMPSLDVNLDKIMMQRQDAYCQAVYIPPNAKDDLKASDDVNISSLMDKVRDFLKSDRQVFLILGISGSGKSTFNRYLGNVLAKEYNHEKPIPLLINLLPITNPNQQLINNHLNSLNFTDNDIQEIKKDRQLVIICDSYDESQLTSNLHTSSMLDGFQPQNTKMIISCRSTQLPLNYRERFQPQPLDPYERATPELFQEAVIVPFSESQIKDYIDRFVEAKEADEHHSWTAKKYMDKLNSIPNLLSLVKNPFLLSLSLRSLPSLDKDGSFDYSNITMTRAKLFEIFIDEWLEVNRKRLSSMNHPGSIQKALEALIQGGFKRIAIDFLQNLAGAIYEKHNGHSVIPYIHRDDKETWKAKFFGPDEEIMLLRQSSPLTSVENMHSFIHRSLLEYFRSLQMVRPIPPSNKINTSKRTTLGDACDDTILDADSDGGESSDNEFEDTHEFLPDDLPYLPECITQCAPTLEPAIPKGTSWFRRVLDAGEAAARGIGSAAESAARGVASGAEHVAHGAVYAVGGVALGSGVAVIGVGLAAAGAIHKIDGVWKRTVQVLTTRKAHVDEKSPIAKTSYVYYDEDVYDTVLVDKETGNKHITQLVFDSSHQTYHVYYRWSENDYKLDGPHATIEEAKSAFQISFQENFGIDWKERETMVSDKWTCETKIYESFEEVEDVVEVVDEKEVEFIRRRACSVMKDVTVDSPSPMARVDGVTKRHLHPILAPRKVRVDSAAPIAKTSKVYIDGDQEVYHAVLVELSGMIFVTQLLFETRISKFYIYTRQGDYSYGMEGPYETVESAKDEFKLSYFRNFEMEWKDRESILGERFIYIFKKNAISTVITGVEENVDEDDITPDIEHKKTETGIVDCEDLVDTRTNTQVPTSPTLPVAQFKLSGLPTSLDNLTTERLYFEMKSAPIFDDRSLGGLDLEEEPEILQFLVDRVHNDQEYTKLLLWTVYKSRMEGIVNQSTKNATSILDMAGIHFCSLQDLEP